MSKGLKKTGYTNKTSERYLIDAATVYTGVKYVKDEGFQGDLHGATSGGVTLTIEQEYRNVEVDGANHVPVRGNQVLETATGTITTNMKEITAETIRRALNGSIADATEDEAPEGYEVIKSKRYIENDDYLENIAIAGRLSGTTKPIIAILDNALCTSGLEVATEDNNEAVIEQVYTAHATDEQLNSDEMPWRIYYPKTTGNTNPEPDPGAEG
ncbi:hypothetical protein ACS127_17215 [Amphibacillus sp. Q70]|uniref:hypothetical protein n=1 Tax=Amphibacillus sp. Q70 TaxID=3453416 RepID=UPI003F86ACD3